MLPIIKQFFNVHLASGSLDVKQDPEHATRLAVAALFIEVTESDYRQLPEERYALLNTVREHFGLDIGEADTLISMAEAEQAETEALSKTRFSWAFRRQAFDSRPPFLKSRGN